MAFPRSGTVDTSTYSGTKDLVAAKNSATQTTNLAAGDHLKLDTIDFARPAVTGGAGALGGGAVRLDTTTAYSSSNGAASLGRFTLQGGKVYRLECQMGESLSTAGSVQIQWADVTAAPVLLGSPAIVYSATFATAEGSSGGCVAFYAPGGSAGDLFLVEVRITAVAGTPTAIGDPTKGAMYAVVETI